MRRIDMTVLAIPGFVGAMVAEHWWQRRHPAPPGTSRRGDYELADTLASLAMGVASLLTPMISTKLLDPVTPTKGRHGKDLQPAAASPPERVVAASASGTCCARDTPIDRGAAAGRLPRRRPGLVRRAARRR
jgi:hypothetical protein